MTVRIFLDISSGARGVMALVAAILCIHYGYLYIRSPNNGSASRTI